MPYDAYQAALAPTWLQGPNGQNFLGAMGLLKDALGETVALAVKARWLGTCPDDALAFISQERQIDGILGETPAALRSRLQQAWALWSIAGTKAAVINAVKLLGYTNVAIKENGDWAVPPSPGYNYGDEWWRFWVIIYPPHPFNPTFYLGDGTLVGPSRILGLSGDVNRIPDIGLAINKWKPAHAKLVNCTIFLSGKILGDGTWVIGDGSLIGYKAAQLTF